MKKKKKQRIIAVIVTFLMMVNINSGMTITASAVTTLTASTYAELTTAITNAVDGDTISITGDFTVTSKILILGKALIIEGNNHTIKVPVIGLDDSGIYNTNPSDFGVFNINASGKTVEIKKLTVKGGVDSTVGAAISNNFGTTLKLNNVNVSNSRSSGGGGAIINRGNIYLNGCNVSRNAASYGGGFFNSGVMFIENSTFSENRSTAVNGGGGAGENQGNLYVNNSTFSNNKSTELGGAINNCGGTAYFANSTFAGNVAYGGYSGGAIAQNGAMVKVTNCLFAYNYINSGTSTSPIYTLNDVQAYRGLVDAYYCVFQDQSYATNINNKGGNNLYTGNANGTDNTLFNNGINTKVLGPDGVEVGTNTIFQPFLAVVENEYTPTNYLKSGSFAFSKGVKTSFTNGNGTPTIGYYDGSSWITILGSNPEKFYVNIDQNNKVRNDTPTIGSLELAYPNMLYMLKVNAADGGTVVGGTVYGDVYPDGKTVELTAKPIEGYGFKSWEYVEGGTGTASTANPYTVTVSKNISLKPVYEKVPTFVADITAPTNKSVNVTTTYPDGARVKKYSLDGITYSDSTETTKTIEFASNGTLYAKSDSGIVSTYNITNIDKIAPTTPTLVADVTYPTNGNVVVTINYPGDSSKQEYKLGSSGKWTTYSSAISVSANETVYARVADIAGNTSEEGTLVISNIDQTLPLITIGSYTTAVTNENITVTAWTNEGTLNATSYTFEENGSYTFEATDDAGNVTLKTVTISNIDKIKPENPIFSASKDNTIPTNQDVNVTITYPRDSVINKYSLNGLDYKIYVGEITVTENNTKIYAMAQDEAGNIIINTYIITNIDKIRPEKATFEVNEIGASNVTIIYPTDAAVLQYSLDRITYNNYSGTILVPENVSVYAKSQDAAGNWSEISSIDRTKPENVTYVSDITEPTNVDVNVTIIYPADAVDKVYVMNGNISSYHEPIKFTINGTIMAWSRDASGNYSGVSTYEVNNIDKTAPEITLGSYTTAATNQNITVTATVNEGALNVTSHTFTENGSYTFTATDIVGNVTSKEVIILNIDKIIPKNAAFEPDKDNTVPTNGEVNVTIDYPADAVVKQYSVDGITYFDYIETIKFTRNETVYAKSQDAAGNWSNVSSYVVANIDKKVPVLTSEEENIPPSNTDKTIKFKLTKGGQYYYIIVDEGAPIPTIDTTVEGIPCNAGEITINNLTGLGSGGKIIYLVVKDNAGNLSNVLMYKIAKYVPSTDDDKTKDNINNEQLPKTGGGLGYVIPSAIGLALVLVGAFVLILKRKKVQ